MADQDDGTYIATPRTESAQDNPAIALSIPGELPKKIIVNGVTYRRELDNKDMLTNNIRDYQDVAERTGLTLRQVIWFNERVHGGSVLPD